MPVRNEWCCQVVREFWEEVVTSEPVPALVGRVMSESSLEPMDVPERSHLAVDSPSGSSVETDAWLMVK